MAVILPLAALESVRTAERESARRMAVPYLPTDNIESPLSEQVIDAISKSLDAALTASPTEFWRRVQSEKSLVVCLASYLQFCRRPSENDGLTVPGHSKSRQELSRKVFCTLLRMVSQEPGAGLQPAQQAQVLYSSWILDVPKLLDIAAVYGRTNPELTKRLIAQAFALQPRYLSDLESAAALITSNLSDVQRTCSGAAEATLNGHAGALVGLADGLAYLADTCDTLACFCEAYPPAAGLLTRGDSLMATLGSVHGDLLRDATRAWAAARKRLTEKQTALSMQRSLAQLEAGLARIAGTLLSCAFFCEPSGVSPTQQTASGRAAPDAKSQGAAFLSALQSGSGGGLLEAAEQRYSLSQRLDSAIRKGYLALDEAQQSIAFALLGSSRATLATPNGAAAEADCKARAVEREGRLRQIREVLPGYGDGFLAACLDAAGQDTERVVAQLLEGSLPAELAALDPQMPLNDAGTAVSSRGAARPPNGAALGSRGNGPAESAASPAQPSKPAQAHRGTAYALRQTPREKALAKLHARAAQWHDEYDDEYDDAFDDTDGFEADAGAEPQADRLGADAPGSAGPGRPHVHVQPKGGKPLWVLNGRVYNYRKEGATPVPNQAAAEEVVRAQTAAAREVHGLSAGGNRAGGSAEGATSEAGSSGRATTHGGRGGRGPPPDSRRTHAFKSEHKAAIGNHHRKDRALRKMGGPAS